MLLDWYGNMNLLRRCGVTGLQLERELQSIKFNSIWLCELEGDDSCLRRSYASLLQQRKLDILGKRQEQYGCASE